ncbi:MAG: isochorismatase family cysteine hydrolase [Lactimicrobium sp.]|jgi:nicotinamidase/pyrazinamidase|uniref:cysteine hydrolase family protein n=1 Tax=Lactimicrobium sp. TaxID=2563780 RepID=UPI002F35B616
MKHVLVVVDMQKDFVDGALGTKEAQQIVPAVVQAILDPGYDTVIATLDTHDENYLHSQEGKYLPVEHCIKGTPGWQLVPQVKEALTKRNAQIIEKPTFGSLALMELLQKEQPEDVTLCGLCTDICVLSNAMLIKTALYQKDVYILKEATAGVTPEKKKSALDAMASCQIQMK